MKLHHAQLSFNDKGTPQSDAFGDVYFSNDNGMAESEYVFLQANALKKRWGNWPHAHFNIGETGFGTGLNFLLTLKAFAEFKQNKPQARLQHLHFFSVEKYPIKRDDLHIILTTWPSLTPYAEPLLAQYPEALSGIHRSHYLQHTVTLDLVLGDALWALSELHAHLDGLIHAWYLDGFMPSKNAQMWSPEVYQEMARLSADRASLATFTAAGAVKRGLQAVGFTVTKIKGHGRKREMITARFEPRKHSDDIHSFGIDHQKAQRLGFVNSPTTKHHIFSNKQAPYFQRLGKRDTHTPQELTIVGAGIAGALAALRLTQAGIKVRLLCKDAQAAMGASGNPVGGFYPQLNAEAGINSQFFVHAFLYARRFYDELLKQDVHFEHAWCGVLQLGFNENTQERLQKMQDKALWPETLAHVVSAEQASQLAGIDLPYPALFLPQAGWISPLSLVNACLQAAQQTGLLELMYESTLLDFQSVENASATAHISDKKPQTDILLRIKTQNDEIQSVHTQALILAAGDHSRDFLEKTLPLRITRGQVEAMPPTPSSQHLRMVLCHKGYFTPAFKGYHALGSTYVKHDVTTEHRQHEVEQNLHMHCKAMQDASWVDELKTVEADTIKGRAAIRLSTPDHLPLLGNVPNVEAQSAALNDLYKALPAQRYPLADNMKGVYLLTALGSRGITSAPVLVDTLVAQILNQPLPLGNTLLNALSPNRFLVRSLIRQQDYLV